MRVSIVFWAIRLVVVGAIAVAFNYWLLDDSTPAEAIGSQRYAKVEHVGYWGNYLGIEGDVLVGNPIPCSPGQCSFSNQTLWAGRTSGCSGPSWIETGWYKGYHSITGVFGWYYKFMYRVPGTAGCQYTEAPVYGTPQIGTAPKYRLERYSGTQWRFYWIGQHVASVTTGWTYADDVQAGGEVSNTTLGMDGGVNNMKFKVGAGWFGWIVSDPNVVYTCDYGYLLSWQGNDDIRDVGYYNGPGNCPD